MKINPLFQRAYQVADPEWMPDSDVDELLEGFVFADDESRDDALYARTWAYAAHEGEISPLRPPMIVITGPRGSGKTELARRIVGGLSAKTYEGNGLITAGLLDRIATDEVKIHVFDDHGGGMVNERIDGMALSRFLVAERWLARPLNREPRVVELSSMLMVTTRSFEAFGELAELFVIIRLQER